MFHDICAWPIAIAAIGSHEAFFSAAGPAVERLFIIVNGKLRSRRRGGMNEQRKIPVRRTLTLLGALVLVTACAAPPLTTPAERLEFYRANAGKPVDSFHSPARLWGWRALGDSALTVWTSKNQGFLLELANQCPEMAVASSIGLTTRNEQVAAGLDSVLIQRRGGADSLSACRIDTIRPINTRVVKESRSDMQDVGLVTRDPAAPDAPQ
jgi:hypothetical protein